MKLTGNEFLGFGKKGAENKIAYFFVLGNMSGMESGLCD